MKYGQRNGMHTRRKYSNTNDYVHNEANQIKKKNYDNFDKFFFKVRQSLLFNLY